MFDPAGSVVRSVTPLTESGPFMELFMRRLKTVLFVFGFLGGVLSCFAGGLIALGAFIYECNPAVEMSSASLRLRRIP